ncbi:MAG: ABC transporter ATP-binding protein [Desulfurococcales archaeon]|nr:ABC transporter ATP-binding protein [Desulfurococcales archaeon]MCE4622324.1 ABC transporter ATP-binding protein [Desulfurococcales archaeon]MCE4626520.1 ABC transporter ATP-binding protein [Desulfurococcales archaeon]MCE4629536.1 ABC transporter ATP-binding protein [Desulfurococcales archaeon]
MSYYRIELGEEILRVNDLHVWFPVRRGILDVITGKAKLFVRAVDGISFNLREREIFCLVGESGCGKTTTGKALMKLVPITKGTAHFKPREETLEKLHKLGVTETDGGWVEILSLPEKKYKPIRRDIQMIYQDPYGSLNPRFRVKDILEEPLLVHGIGESKEERLELIAKTLERVKLIPASDFIDRYPHQLSGGQRQRVAIARAIISNPRLVVADEPVSMLDVSIRAEILEVLLDLRKTIGVSYIFITHDLAVARYICDRIAVMYLGKIVELGDAREVIADPLHPYTKALIAAIPDPDPKNRIGYREMPIKGEVPNAINIPPGCRFHPRCVSYDAEVQKESEIAELCPRYEPPLAEVRKDHYVSCWLHEAVRRAREAK